MISYKRSIRFTMQSKNNYPIHEFLSFYKGQIYQNNAQDGIPIHLITARQYMFARFTYSQRKSRIIGKAVETST